MNMTTDTVTDTRTTRQGRVVLLEGDPLLTDLVEAFYQALDQGVLQSHIKDRAKASSSTMARLRGGSPHTLTLDAALRIKAAIEYYGVHVAEGTKPVNQKLTAEERAKVRRDQAITWRFLRGLGFDGTQIPGFEKGVPPWAIALLQNK